MLSLAFFIVAGRGMAAGEADTPEFDQLIVPPLLNVPGPEEFCCCFGV